jgi:protein-tyrosine-phosphatase
MYSQLDNYIQTCIEETNSLPLERKDTLDKISAYVTEKSKLESVVNLVFICTHNSRRSHLAQVWSYAAAAYYGKTLIRSYSAGTEVTAMNPRALAALIRVGFQETHEISEDENHQYLISYEDNAEPIKCYSKTYESEANPQENFAAVMVCDDAEQNCPFIPGADLRILLSYRDPKEADNTSEEIQRYDERCKQIAVELLYLMNRV